MKKLTVFPMCLGCVLAAATSHATDLKQSKVTQVINDVQIISASDQKEKAAVINDMFSMPDLLRTGAASRAELVAEDQTVTRVGANTIFSFDPANRTIDLKEGSLLFHSPHGKGGGTIHTGSATASVLGTTLIVVTTPNGGLKVIALEGRVEVKFPNALKQKLNPGQMTFVLPGANQLAPVVNFRLDELTRNSLLIKGFSQPLASLSLIQNQVTKQNKLISSGRLSDTGLYAGNNATSDQVEVIDPNTISANQKQQEKRSQLPPPPPPPPPPSIFDLVAAEAADATINQSSLTADSIPTPPLHIDVNSSFPLRGNTYFGSQMFRGFVANNIFVNTPGQGKLEVDLSPYTHLAAFDIVAKNNFSVEGTVVFLGLTSEENFALIAGNQFIFTPGIALIAEANNFLLSSPSALSFDNVSLYNLEKDINLNSASDISFLNNSQVSASGALVATAGNSIFATDSSLTGSSATLRAVAGEISFDNTTLNAPSHSVLIAPASINLNNSTINSDSVILSGSGVGGVSLNNTVINASSSVMAVCAGDIDVTSTQANPGSPESRSVNQTGPGAVVDADPATGTVTLNSTAGSVNVSGTSITAHYLTLNSGDGILLDASGHTVIASGPGATASFTAPNLITVNNADLTSYAVVNMAANTINLSDVAFGARSRVTLRSLLGMLNVGSSIPGDVNFIQNVTYGGNPAQNYVGNGITVTTLH